MRSDYALYAVAIVFFILTGVVVAYSALEQTQLWIVTTAVLGLVFIGLGYTQRPRQATSITTTPTITTQITTTPPPPPVLTIVKEEVKEEKTEQIAVEPSTIGLTQVKGIKEKRAEQLKTIGINSIDDLANASANDIAGRLQISPKITGKWIESAKELAKRP